MAADARHASLCHAYSSDDRIPASAAFDAPVLTRGYRITYMTPQGPGVAAGLARGVDHVPLPMTRKIDPAGDVRGLMAMERTFARRRFDVVHTHNAKVGILARMAATVARVPVVVHTVHGLPFHADRDRALRTAYVLGERLANLRTDAVLTQSEEDTVLVRSLGLIAPSRVHYVGNGVDLERFDPARVGDRTAARRRFGFGEDEFVVACAARLRIDKGISELIEGARLARMRAPKLRLALAGTPDTDGRFAVETTALAAAQASGDYVLGQVDDMPALYLAADVVCLPSWHEGLPRALMEGAAMGRPLVATDVPGCREVVRTGIVGTRVPVRDAQALAAALVDFALSPADGSANRAMALERFDVRRTAARIADLYDALLQDKRARARTHTD